MGNFRDTLRELLAKVTSKPSPQGKDSPSVEGLRPNKNAECWQNAEHSKPATPQPLMAQTPSKHAIEQKISDISGSKVSRPESMPRNPYFFQIGFDFGTSSSKAVVRDINTNRAWVYTDSNVADNFAFLIPSVVIYRDGNFERHLDSGTLYPEGGLYHLKMAVEKVAMGIVDVPILAKYKNILGQNSPYKPDYITKLACIYLISSAISDIVASIIQKFPMYGQNVDDQMAINMAIPASNISDNKVRSYFEHVLNISWKLSWEIDSFPQKISIVELEQKVRECERYITEHGKNELCHVYPEVSANVQAFVRSPASSPDETTIYFFSDAGAGTVDQSVFTYAGGEKRLLNYFAARVFSRGSSQIEITACGDTVDESNLEFWRKEKERGQDSPILNRAKIKVEEELKADTRKTLSDTWTCLPFGAGGISPANTLKDKIKFIFSGGGHAEFPYQSAVISAYKDSPDTGRDPLVTSMARPPDLDVPKEYDHWMNRLYVAYGLSFLFHDLAENSYPEGNKIHFVEAVTPRDCSCRGNNNNCVRCYGSGIVQ